MGLDWLKPLLGEAAFTTTPVVEQLRAPRSRMQVGPVTTSPTTEEWLNSLIRRQQPPAAPPQQGVTDEALLAASVPEQEVIGSAAEQAAASQPAPPMDWISQLVPPEEEAAPAAPEPRVEALAQRQQGPSPAAAIPSRQQMLLNSLVRPTREEGVKAGLFDGLFGGSKYGDDLKARRNSFDQALIGAQAGDAAGALHAADAQQQRDQFLRSDETDRRGQNLNAEQRAEDRATREQMARANDLRARELAAEREAGATKRTMINKHGSAGGGGAGAGNPARAEKTLDGEAGYLAGRISSPGQPAVTMETVKKFLQGELEPGTLTPEQEEGVKRGKAALDLAHLIDDKAYGRQIVSGETREAGIDDKIGTSLYLKEWDPGKRMNVMNEITVRNDAVSRAIAGWKGLTDAERDNIVKLGYGDASDASLSPKAQSAAAAIQDLANFDIKAQAGSAVTESEWGRQARTIGLPDKLSIFKAPQVMEDWLRKHDRIRKQMIRNANTAYEGLFTSDKKGHP